MGKYARLGNQKPCNMIKILDFDLGDEEGPLKGFEVLSSISIQRDNSCIGIKNGLKKDFGNKKTCCMAGAKVPEQVKNLGPCRSRKNG